MFGNTRPGTRPSARKMQENRHLAILRLHFPGVLQVVLGWLEAGAGMRDVVVQVRD